MKYIEYLLRRNRLFDLEKMSVGFNRLDLRSQITNFDIQNHEHHDRYMKESKDFR